MRTATLHRATAETEVRLTLHLDGGEARIQTGLGYFDHMLMQLARHGGPPPPGPRTVTVIMIMIMEARAGNSSAIHLH